MALRTLEPVAYLTDRYGKPFNYCRYGRAIASSGVSEMHLYIDEFKEMRIRDFATYLLTGVLEKKGKLISELKYWDVICDGTSIIKDECGIYIVSDESQVHYVGMSTSEALVTRIGNHLAAGGIHWKNNLMRGMADFRKETASFVSDSQAAQLGNLRIRFIHIMHNCKPKEIREHKGAAVTSVRLLETMLRCLLKPRKNEYRKPINDHDRLVGNILSDALLYRELP
ncbi:hypothetical protein [Azospirillum himalayense]|uniref:GIY-YIG domain-containing protein n=1 Tax=Azospirillum himalayense TaxID=654847 RepID=A0ABW0G918_9PROT